MAKVIIIHYGGVLVAGKYRPFIFYEGLVSALRKNGNDVMEIITNDFLERPWNGSNKLRRKIKRSKVIGDIVHFKPDVIISFNNSSIEGLEREVVCPIAVWDADHFYHFNDLDLLRANKERYLFFCSQSSDILDCQKILGADPGQCFLIKPATSIQAKPNHKKTNNIVFIGTPFGNAGEKEKLCRYKNEYIELVKKMIHKEDNAENLMRTYAKKIPEVDQTILDFGSVSNRNNTLAHVAPLGLSLYGGAGWLEIGLDFSLDIFNAYNPQQVYSVSQTQEVYNSSKIGLNINHTQAKSGYSWRVMDVLASSAVLVSNYSKDLAEDLGDLSKEIFYNTPQEAYIVCSRLLQDENLRKRIVSQSNEIVRKFHTWEVRITEIERVLKVGLVSSRPIEGEYILLDAKKYYTFFAKTMFYMRHREGILVNSIFFLLPYGMVKIINNQAERRFLMNMKNIRISFSNVSLYALMARGTRFILPYGVIWLIRMIKNFKISKI